MQCTCITSGCHEVRKISQDDQRTNYPFFTAELKLSGKKNYKYGSEFLYCEQVDVL